MPASARLTRCPSCDGKDLREFHRVEGIPVHSCLLMPSREKAVGYPRGELELSFCRSCGFIANTRFDEKVHEYSTAYEETQGFSPRFRQFLEDQVRWLVERYSIRDKTVLEIGCGKGEFLVLICEQGDNRGIGVDPAYVPERTSSPAAERIEFIQDFYSEKYAHLEADVVCCRHTLEHISNTGEFLRGVRGVIGDRPDTLVFFELPDVARVLWEGAYWDMYYEHCSYFSAGSLARLFRASGFDLLDLQLEYDDQYIVVVARPAAGPTTPSLPLEDDLARLEEGVERFGEAFRAQQEKWSRFFERGGGRTVVWGSGSKGVSFLTTLGFADRIEYVVDINPYRQGKFMPGTGQEIVSPEFLKTYRPDRVVVMNPIYVEEIRADLERFGLTPEIHAV